LVRKKFCQNWSPPKWEKPQNSTSILGEVEFLFFIAWYKYTIFSLLWFGIWDIPILLKKPDIVVGLKEWWWCIEALCCSTTSLLDQPCLSYDDDIELCIYHLRVSMYVQQKVSLYAKWFDWILNEFIGTNELDLMRENSEQKVSLYAKWFYWILNEFIGTNELDLMREKIVNKRCLCMLSDFIEF
jgi:hypothetical protein